MSSTTPPDNSQPSNTSNTVNPSAPTPGSYDAIAQEMASMEPKHQRTGGGESMTAFMKVLHNYVDPKTGERGDKMFMNALSIQVATAMKHASDQLVQQLKQMRSQDQ
ncbi:MAG: hypothetical protein KGI80_05555 [Verrucomicrobiota bacterium]|nr:hypothetical protein [Verrucomicrobiota bacterium]